ncbi:MAG: DUF2147 domain-containing protein [Flavobacteriaceae bacterium]|nr:DUF2147 domain-containing protein [Flavobacteriaceae bacterium]
MSKITLFIIAFMVCGTLCGQSIFGKWKTVDDETGEQKSIIEIYERDGKVFGKIVEILKQEHKNAVCVKCAGDEKNRPVLGLELIKNMEPEGRYYKKGTIFDPEHGKKYRCRLALTEDPDVLQVRGYIAFLYSTQYWLRVE